MRVFARRDSGAWVSATFSASSQVLSAARADHWSGVVLAIVGGAGACIPSLFACEARQCSSDVATTSRIDRVIRPPNVPPFSCGRISK
jgi:hypothetical protein